MAYKDRCWSLQTGLMLTYLLTSVNGQMGTLFITALYNHYKWPDVILKMTTLSSLPIHVSITDKNVTILKQLTITKSKPDDYVISDDFISANQNVTYVLQGSGSFGVYLFTATTNSMETSLLLPVNYWGKSYFITILKKSPTFFLVMSYAEGTTIYMWIPLPRVVVLARFGTFAAVLNHTGEVMQPNFIAVSPFGVLVGALSAETVAYRCSSLVSTKPKTQDIMLESLVSTESAGKVFIRFNPSGRVTKGSGVTVIQMTCTNTTDVTVSNTTTTKNFVVAHNEYVEIQDQVKGSLLIQSSNPVIVVYAQPSTCVQNDRPLLSDGDTSLTIIVPVELFYDIYFFDTPVHATVKIKHFMAIIVKVQKKDLIKFNEMSLDEVAQNSRENYRETLSGWEIWILSLDGGQYEVYSNPVVYFGCYVYGYGSESGYMMPVGMMNSKMWGDFRTCVLRCSKESSNMAMVAGDQVDNDCDGYIDEELLNDIDDDDDSKIDEDLAKKNRVNGGWSQWTEWGCSKNCSDNRIHRNRECNNPTPINDGNYCPGADAETQSGNCYLGKKCPTECGVGFWGEGCELTCENCEPECEKFSGHCNTCKAGFKNPKERCAVGCEENEYGPNCLKNCTAKCGEDCAERIYGFCRRHVTERATRRRGTRNG